LHACGMVHMQTKNFQSNVILSSHHHNSEGEPVSKYLSTMYRGCFLSKHDTHFDNSLCTYFFPLYPTSWLYCTTSNQGQPKVTKGGSVNIYLTIQNFYNACRPNTTSHWLLLLYNVLDCYRYCTGTHGDSYIVTISDLLCIPTSFLIHPPELYGNY
jgi:hypothetical protein